MPVEPQAGQNSLRGRCEAPEKSPHKRTPLFEGKHSSLLSPAAA